MSSANRVLSTGLGPQAKGSSNDGFDMSSSTPLESEQADNLQKSPEALGYQAESNNDATPASIKYRVIYEEYQGEAEAEAWRVVERGPYIETLPSIYEDLINGSAEIETPNKNGGSVFDVLIRLEVKRFPDKKIVQTQSQQLSMSGSNSNNETESDPDSEPEIKVKNTTIHYADVDEVSEERAAKKYIFKTVNGKRFKIYSYRSSEIRIKSPVIIDAVKAAMIYHPKLYFNEPHISFTSPYPLLQYREELLRFVEEALEAGKNGEAREKALKLHADYQVLNNYLEAKWSKKIEAELVRYQQDPPVATFEMLWMLFKPGNRVISTEKQELSDDRGGFIVRSMNRIGSLYKLSLWRLAFDGLTMYRAKVRRWIRVFQGELEIRKLGTYPIEIKVGNHLKQLDPELQIRLEKRGEHYWGFIRQIMQRGSVEVNYDGPVGGETNQDGSYTGRAILDPTLYLHQSKEHQRPKRFLDYDDFRIYENSETKMIHGIIGKHASAERGIWHDYQDISETSLKHRSIVVGKGHFFLCPPNISGFLLKTRTFDILDVEYAHPCVRDEAIIDTLRIPRSRLDMIKALTQKYDNKQKTWSADFIQNKGEGQIFLLHGPSGVGKTYTAECIAKLTGRPLLALTVADIGTNEEDMEESLAKWFKFSEAWEAIMLIDEADVYFERRGGGQLKRNSLVSAFLRSMEYYRGILFLTTNRLGHIDDAILSRIHLIIEYTDLSDEDRVKIWLQFFKKLETDRPNFKVDEYMEGFIENDRKVVELQWNGREIRNAFQTAVALAEYSAKTAVPPKEKVIVTKKHLEGVVEMSGAFKKYMRDWKGDVDKRAFLDGSRMDQGMKIRREELEMAREAARSSRMGKGKS